MSIKNCICPPWKNPRYGTNRNILEQVYTVPTFYKLLLFNIILLLIIVHIFLKFVLNILFLKAYE